MKATRIVHYDLHESAHRATFSDEAEVLSVERLEPDALGKLSWHWRNIHGETGVKERQAALKALALAALSGKATTDNAGRTVHGTDPTVPDPHNLGDGVSLVRSARPRAPVGVAVDRTLALANAYDTPVRMCFNDLFIDVSPRDSPEQVGKRWAKAANESAARYRCWREAGSPEK